MSTAIRLRIMRGVGANLGGHAVTVATQLLGVPIFVYAWGNARYGEWLVLTAIPAYFALTDLGLAAVAANDMTSLSARGEQRAALAVFQSTWIFVAIVSAVVAVVAVPVVLAAPLDSWFDLRQIGGTEAAQICILQVAYVLASLQGGLISAGFRAAERYALGIHLANAMRLFEFAVLCAVLLGGGGPVAAAWMLLISRCIGLAVQAGYLTRSVAWLRYGLALASWNRVRDLLKPGLFYLAFPLGNAFSQQGVTVVLGATLGTTAVVTFTTLRTLSRIALQAMGTVNNAVWPELSAAYGRGDTATLRALHRKSCAFAFWIALLAVAALAPTGAFLHRIWTHGQVPFDHDVWLVLLLSLVMSSLWYTSSVVPTSMNKHAGVATGYLVATAASLAGTALLVGPLGLVGAAAALTIIDIALVPVVLRTSARLTDDRVATIVVSLISPGFRTR